MKQPLPKPVQRSPLRLALGKLYFENRRRLHWYFSGTQFANQRNTSHLPYLHMQHGTPMLRELSGVDMELQRNKMQSLALAALCIDGLTLKPGEVFSFWRLVGRPTARRGFKMGFVLKNGTLAQDIGGGLCQMTNLIYWMTIHTDLEVVERWRHGFDVFPDAGRTQPFASGATCAFNYIDLQIRNPTSDTYQLNVWQKETWLRGAWRCNAPLRDRFKVFEKNHEIRPEWWGGYSRHNELWRQRLDADTGAMRGEEFIAANHAIMMYEPLLPMPEPRT